MELASVELFAGAGGLALGFSEHGVRHRAIIEWNKHACETLRNNKKLGVSPVCEWPDVSEGDVRDFCFEKYSDLDLITGGPPCQPFSMGGKHGGFLDERDMFPQAIRAVHEARPRAFVFENVRGLVRTSFQDYFNYIVLQLEYPSLKPRAKEQWLEHLVRLEHHKAQGGKREYYVFPHLVNAANFGVPQKRMRVFFVGFRRDVYRPWAFPRATHSQAALLLSQWDSGEYWDRHRIAKKNRPAAPEGIERKLISLRKLDPASLQLPWRTVRDEISDLPDPEIYQSSKKFQAHRFQPGARAYPGHTGSPLDEPAKALKAGDHGVPGGENMLRRPDGTVRYFTIRESARIQTFPNEIILEGSWGEIMRQLGNAVPVKLASAVAMSVCTVLRQQPQTKDTSELLAVAA